MSAWFYLSVDVIGDGNVVTMTERARGILGRIESFFVVARPGSGPSRTGKEVGPVVRKREVTENTALW
jgi:hypothetical protein